MSKKRDRVFISYRSDDSAAAAAFLSSVLKSHFGDHTVFFAPNEIKGGSDFPDRLTGELNRAAVIIVVIGPRWLSVKDQWQKRRVDSNDDWVRKEVAYGLASEEIQVIPYLLEGAQFPSPQQAATALPDDLTSLARKHVIRATQAHEIPSSLIESVRSALHIPSPQVHDSDPSKGIRGNRYNTEIVVVHAAMEETHSITAANDKPTDHGSPSSYKEQLVELLEQVLPGKVSIHAPGEPHSRNMSFTTSELLTCQAGVFLIDREALVSEFVRRRAELLAWRGALGMPLASILLHGLRRAELKRSPVAFLSDFLVIENAHGRAAKEITAKEIARVTQQYIEDAMSGRIYSFYSDPATKWASDVTDILSEVSDNSIPELAERLHIPANLLERADDPRKLIAAVLFHADLDAAYDFLRYAVQHLRERNAPRGRNRALVDRAIPIWVDLDAGREILTATHLPSERRLCGLRLSRLEWAEHAVSRASAGALQYPSVRLTSVAGEHAVEELIVRHDLTLRNLLNLSPQDGPGFIEKTLFRMNRAIFAILDAKNLSTRQLKEVLRSLHGRFPGITFLLVSDRKNDTWKFRPPIKMVMDTLDQEKQNDVAYFIRVSKALIERGRNRDAE